MELRPGKGLAVDRRRTVFGETPNLFRLALRYLLFHRWVSLLLLGALTLLLAFPLVAWRWLERAERRYTLRALQTPLVIGRRANDYALVIRSLYFQGPQPPSLPYRSCQELRARGAGVVIPIYQPCATQGHPLVGTAWEYFGLRGLRLGAGAWPAVLGECVVGSEVARVQGLQPGGRLVTDVASFLNLAHDAPFRLQVTGILAPTDGPDDLVVFTDLKTAWVVAGLGHGHEDLVQGERAGTPGIPLDSNQASVTQLSQQVARILGAGVEAYREVNARNLATFHFHGDPAEYPVQALIVVPAGSKEATIASGEANASEERVALVPVEVVGSLLEIVFNVQRVFDSYLGMVALATLAFLVIVVLLSLRNRQAEFRLLAHLGCPPQTAFTLLFLQFLVLAGLSLFSSLALAWVALWALGRLLPL